MSPISISLMKCVSDIGSYSVSGYDRRSLRKKRTVQVMCSKIIADMNIFWSEKSIIYRNLNQVLRLKYECLITWLASLASQNYMLFYFYLLRLKMNCSFLFLYFITGHHFCLSNISVTCWKLRKKKIINETWPYYKHLENKNK